MFHSLAGGLRVGEDMMDTMYVTKYKAPVLVLHCMFSSGNLKLELNVDRSRCNVSTHLTACEELVKNW